ncbi:unnamed protein product [Nesidiocoris tenuis]|uniref:Uncharacterized protein n=1 Tax=Nesidiocoris tenuis TaxID=355587 RepID=A0A6H5HB20_9HEMI|nr:unnamed protein product [Nesidiocoris tenuis]
MVNQPNLILSGLIFRSLFNTNTEERLNPMLMFHVHPHPPRRLDLFLPRICELLASPVLLWLSLGTAFDRHGYRTSRHPHLTSVATPGRPRPSLWQTRLMCRYFNPSPHE